MLRILVFAVVIANLAGCESMAEAARQQQAARQAQQDALRARIAELPREQKAHVQRCSSIAVGKIAALRNADQGGSMYGVTDYTIVDSCLADPSYYTTVPAPKAQVVVNAVYTPLPDPGP